MNPAEVFCGTKTYNRQQAHRLLRKEATMAEKIAEKMPKEKIQELKEMIKEKTPDQPIEKVLVNFCERHAVSLKTCRKYYERLVEKGEVKKE
jgi:truncated hemoglobin YjbI